MLSENRMQHQLAVARRVVEMAKQRGGYSEEELQELFVMGYLHDIGYEFAKDPDNHAVVGGEVLRQCGFKYWQEIASHGDPESSYFSPELDLLNSADMHTSPLGEAISYEERLKGIRERYGSQSPRYLKAINVIQKLEEAGYN